MPHPIRIEQARLLRILKENRDAFATRYSRIISEFRSQAIKEFEDIRFEYGYNEFPPCLSHDIDMKTIVVKYATKFKSPPKNELHIFDKDILMYVNHESEDGYVTLDQDEFHRLISKKDYELEGWERKLGIK
jgi:hypothetical protein